MASWFRRQPSTAAEWIARMHSGTMSAADRAAMSKWLASRPEHRREYERTAAAWELAQDLGSSAVAKHYLAARPTEWRAARSRPRVMGFGFAAAGLAAAMLALVVLPGRGVHATGPGQIETIALDDGSVVWLNADSRVRVEFTAPFRRVVLERGEAFFKVAHDTSRPFVVEAEPRRIVVTGTEFDVRRAPDAVEVSVAEGHVKVETPSVGTGQPQPVTALIAGEDAHFPTGAIVPAVLHGTVAQHKGAWREGKIYLDDTQLGAALDEINRYSPTKLVLADESLRRQPISGDFRTGDTEAVLFSLHALFKLEARREPGRIVLYPPGG
jgi:transmembrane sensor